MEVRFRHCNDYLVYLITFVKLLKVSTHRKTSEIGSCGLQPCQFLKSCELQSISGRNRGIHTL